jgi:hypothetical protein
MQTLRRSWQLTRVSFGVIRDEPALLVLPVLAVLFSGLFVGAIVWPAVVFDPPSEEARRATLYGAAFAVYFGLAFVATFFNTCVVYTARARFHGEDPTLGAALGFALSKVGKIAGWSLVAATVGILFKLLDRVAERSGPFGRLILNVVHATMGVTWSVLTLFVVPAMVCRDIGPIDALRHASRALRKTWGEGLVLQVGLGAMQAVLVIAGILGFVGLLQLTNGANLLALGVAAVVYFVAVGAVFNLAGTIYGTALFMYADSGELPPGYEGDLLTGAIGSRR